MAAVALALLALSSAQLSAEPTFAVGGSAAPVALTLTVDADEGPVKLSTNVGSVSEPARAADGRLTATFTPPPQRFPQVALLLAETGRRRHWLALPIHGTETLELTTKPNARVEVAIAEASFTGRADRRGKLAVPVVVPPGIARARVRSVDRLGNARTQSLSLEPPPFPLARAVLVQAEGASWADPAPVTLELFVVSPRGAPLSRGEPALEADQGRLEGRVQRQAPGIFQVAYRAPDEVGSGTATVKVLTRESPRASGTFSSIDIPLRPGPPASLTMRVSPATFRAGSETPVTVEAVAKDAKGNVLVEGVSLTPNLGTLARSEDGQTHRLTLPDAFGGRTHATVRASAGALEELASITLTPAEPRTGSLVMSSTLVRAGEGTRGEVTLRDAFGNPVSDAELALTGQRGEARAPEALGEGRYRFDYQLPPDAPRGEDRVEARAPSGSVSLNTDLAVLPYRPAWGVSAGLWTHGLSNGQKVWGAGLSAEGALAIARWPLELVLQGGAHFYRPLAADRPDLEPGYQNLADYRTLHGVLGLRCSLPLSSTFGLHGAAFAGVQHTTSHSFRVENPSTGKVLATLDGVDQQLNPLLRASAGLSVLLGPGRLLLEGQASYTRIRQQTLTVEEAGAVREAPSPISSGNLGGVSLAVGYLFFLR